MAGRGRPMSSTAHELRLPGSLVDKAVAEALAEDLGMGGDITTAVREIQAAGIVVICTSMAGSLVEAADLVVSDPLEAGVMAVMLVADTASFSIERVRGRRF